MKTLRSRQIRRVLVPMMAVSLLSACTNWKVQEVAPSQVVSEKEPGKIRLTMLDRDEVVLENPWVSDGEILAHPMRNAGGHYRAVRSDTLRVVADSVVDIEILETDVASTVVTTVLLLGLTVYVVSYTVIHDGIFSWH